MGTKTEGKHAGEFIIYEMPHAYCRDAAPVASGQNLVDGQLVELSGGKLIAKATTLDGGQTGFATPVEGAVIGNWNRTGTGPDGATDSDPANYLKRGPAIVREESLTFPAGGTQKTLAIAALTAAGILVRNDG